MKWYSPGVNEGIVVAAKNCLTSTYKENKNNCYILAVQQDRLVVNSLENRYIIYAVYHFQMQNNRSPFEIRRVVCLLKAGLLDRSQYLRRPLRLDECVTSTPHYRIQYNTMQYNRIVRI